MRRSWWLTLRRLDAAIAERLTRYRKPTARSSAWRVISMRRHALRLRSGPGWITSRFRAGGHLRRERAFRAADRRPRSSTRRWAPATGERHEPATAGRSLRLASARSGAGIRREGRHEKPPREWRGPRGHSLRRYPTVCAGGAPKLPSVRRAALCWARRYPRALSVLRSGEYIQKN
jgi:hypothetical protein